ncbi:MAG: hypothetical protein H0W78_17605 [Planctomycetes bacterium]|nr:hypothetical protein [Planctomycetota bacterium]
MVNETAPALGAAFVPSAAPIVFAGIWRFTLVSIAGFAPWVVTGGWFYRHVGEAGLYLACLLAFLVAALVLLPGLLSGPRRVQRTAMYFLPAFITYALLWCACWFLLGGRLGEWAGAISGGSAFVLISAWLLGRPRSLLLALVVFVAAHAVGYFAGGQAMHLLLSAGTAKALGMLAWGVCYGLGFGAGLGWLVAACVSR